MGDAIFSVKGKSIVVTGAAGGLGGSMARALAARGARLMLSDVGAEVCDLARDLGPGVAVHRADISAEREADALVAHARERFGGLDGLVNAAGVLRIAPALELDPANFRAALEINVTAAFLLSRAAARAMRAGGGRIVHVASVSSLVANADYAAYATSKAALSQLIRVLAREWAAYNITVNAVGPAMTPTGLTARYLADPGFRRQALAAIPLGRFGTPEDLIGTLILLLSPAGAFITGQTIYVDGGRTLV